MLTGMLPLLPDPVILPRPALPGSPGTPEGKTFDRIVDRNAELLVASVRELVRIQSYAAEPQPEAPFGAGPKEALARALDIAERLGFATTSLDNFAGFAEFGNGDEYVAVLGHVDTVPEGENWTYPPFGGEVHDGKIYGRGALDDKGPALAALFGARAVLESGLPVSRRVRIIFGADEETGEMDMDHYLSREKPPVAGFTPDSDFPVVYAEKGILQVALEKRFITPAHGTIVTRIIGGTAVNMVPDLATAFIRVVHPDLLVKSCARSAGPLICLEADANGVIITSRGESAHASTPAEGKNAIMLLLSFLATQKLSPSGLTDAIRFLDQAIGSSTDGRGLGIRLSDAESGALTVNAGMIAADEEVFRLTIDIRYPVTVSSERVLSLLKESLKGSGFSAAIHKHQPPLHYPADSPLVTKLAGVYRSVTGDATPPVAIGGGTYARKMPNIVAFGPYQPGTKPPIHRQDECIAITELVSLAKIYARAIYELAK